MRRPGRALAAACALIIVRTVTGQAADAPLPPDGGFVLPIDCTLRTDCWIMNYVDTDPGPGVRDSWCNPRSYDGHKGTDIAIRDVAVMARGVNVLAAASGTVLRVRNDAPDREIESNDRVADDRACGNGAVLRHTGGWETQYCHLKKGSVSVRPGDRLDSGQVIGAVGMSGRTEFPHVHFAARFKGQVFDPVGRRLARERCGPPTGGTSSSYVFPYGLSDMYAVGFSDAAPTALGIKRNASERAVLSADAPALVLWGAMFGAFKGQTLTIEIRAPDGAILLRREKAISRNQAWRMEFAGRKRATGKKWPPGRYTGRVTLSLPIDRVPLKGATMQSTVSMIFSRETAVVVR